MNKLILNFYLILPYILILFGITTTILRLTANKYKYFAKLKAMEEKFGTKNGNIIHITFYSVLPILLGIYYLLILNGIIAS